jgi:NAD(P)-dependent dehydrogenase (short-subunit alcohol dehydrogenase family)
MLADLQLRPAAEALLKEYAPESTHGSDTRPVALYHRTNVVSWADLHSLWGAAVKAFVTIDIVCPGAGIFEPAWSSFWESPRTATNPSSASRDPVDADPGHYAVLDINLTAPIRLSQLAIGHWTQLHQKGCLVHIGSIAGVASSITTPLYTASKHGLHGFVRALGGIRDELGIRIGAVAPAMVRVSRRSAIPLPRSLFPTQILTSKRSVRRHPCGMMILPRLRPSPRTPRRSGPRMLHRP